MPDIGATSGPLDCAQTSASVRSIKRGQGHIVLSLQGVRRGGCVATIERALAALPEVVSARVNLTLRQASVTLADAATDPLPMMATLASLGYEAAPADIADADNDRTDPEGARLLRAMAIAGFGAANIMLLSVGVWSGAQEQTRAAFHIISAAIAVPVVAYAGQPFFASAIAALRARRTNMDVPIALGVLLALALSLFETLRGGEHVFFDAAVTLLFFLLAGRYLDVRRHTTLTFASSTDPKWKT